MLIDGKKVVKMIESHKGLLIISLLFAPDTRVGAKRFTILSKILEKTYGCLHVLTIDENQIPNKDRTLKGGGTIHRVKMYPLFPNNKSNNIFLRTFYSLWRDYLCVIDPYSGWILPAFIKSLSIIKRYNIENIIITGPFFSPVVIGILLSVFSRTKIILDYRDPWSTHGWENLNLFKKNTNILIEKIAVRLASGFVFCSRIMKRNFLNHFNEDPSKQYSVITNGCYSNDIVTPLTLGTSQKTMLYAGNFYGERTLSIIARPLANLVKDGIITKETFQFHILGNLNENDRSTIHKYYLEDIIIEHPRVAYWKMFRYLKGADFLFLPSASNVEYAIPFKFFDYLSVRRPIFSVAPKESAVAQIMQEIECGIFSDINNEASIQNGLKKLIRSTPTKIFTNSEQYSWKMIAAQYIRLINTI